MATDENTDDVEYDVEIFPPILTDRDISAEEYWFWDDLARCVVFDDLDDLLDSAARWRAVRDVAAYYPYLLEMLGRRSGAEREAALRVAAPLFGLPLTQLRSDLAAREAQDPRSSSMQ